MSDDKKLDMQIGRITQLNEIPSNYRIDNGEIVSWTGNTPPFFQDKLAKKDTEIARLRAVIQKIRDTAMYQLDVNDSTDIINLCDTALGEDGSDE